MRNDLSERLMKRCPIIYEAPYLVTTELSCISALSVVQAGLR